MWKGEVQKSEEMGTCIIEQSQDLVKPPCLRRRNIGSAEAGPGTGAGLFGLKRVGFMRQSHRSRLVSKCWAPTPEPVFLSSDAWPGAQMHCLSFERIAPGDSAAALYQFTVQSFLCTSTRPSSLQAHTCERVQCEHMHRSQSSPATLVRA